MVIYLTYRRKATGGKVFKYTMSISQARGSEVGLGNAGPTYIIGLAAPGR